MLRIGTASCGGNFMPNWELYVTSADRLCRVSSVYLIYHSHIFISCFPPLSSLRLMFYLTTSLATISTILFLFVKTVFENETKISVPLVHVIFVFFYDDWRKFLT
jgi:hypothetical protein